MNKLQISYGTIAGGRDLIRNYVLQEKIKNSEFRVIDIGGAADGWTSEFVDLIVDINSVSTGKLLQFDLCDGDQWSPLLKHVKEYGQFDFSICTHTLEDLYNPVTVLNYLPIISKGGVITTPSIFTELSNVENVNWIGYIHHRWIFDQKDGSMYLVPKLPVLQYMCKGRKFFSSDTEEIQYFWSSSIPYKLFMDNYLGPNATTVLNAYNKLINGVKHV